MQKNEIIINIKGTNPQMTELMGGWTLTTGISCPACTQGNLMWAENGYTPGYRICSHCGRGWLAAPENDGIHIRIPTIVKDSRGEILEWEWPDDWSAEWAETGDGIDKARAHTWLKHGGCCIIHDESDCSDADE